MNVWGPSVFLEGTRVGLASVDSRDLAAVAQLDVPPAADGHGASILLPKVMIPAWIDNASDLLSDPCECDPSDCTHSSICGESIVVYEAGGDRAITFSHHSTALAEWLITQRRNEARLLEMVRQGDSVFSIHDSPAFQFMKEHQESFPLDPAKTTQVGSLRDDFAEAHAPGNVLKEGQCVAHRLMADWYRAEKKDPDMVDYDWWNTEPHCIAMTSLVAMLIDRGQKPEAAPYMQERLNKLLLGYINRRRLSMAKDKETKKFEI